jgi:hypothetical protein
MARLRSGFIDMDDAAFSSGISATVFMLFVAAGSLYIILAKLAGIGPIFVTFVPVAFMVGYAMLIWLARGLRLRDDQAGDNLYYMGFLFTLTSLGVSLYQFNATRAAEEIVQNFGIAIGSTITGIALRVIFNQMRQDPVEVERTMRLELAEAARRVRRELDSTVVEFSYARRSAHQSAADSFKLVAENFDEIAARLLASLADVALKSAQPLEAASRRSAEMVEQLTKTMAGALSASTHQLGAETEKLSKNAGEISTALGEVTTRLANMRTPDGVLEVRLEPVVLSLTQAIDRFAAQSEGQAAAVRDVMEAAKIAAQSSSASIIALRQEIAASSATNGATLEKATGIIMAMAQILEEFETDAKAQTAALRQLLERTDGVIRAVAEVLHASGTDVVRQDMVRQDLVRQNGGGPDMLPVPRPEAPVPATGKTSIADDAGARHPVPVREATK